MITQGFVNLFMRSTVFPFGRVAHWKLVSSNRRPVTKFLEVAFSGGPDGSAAAQRMQRSLHRQRYDCGMTLHVTYADLRRLPKSPRFLPFVVVVGNRGQLQQIDESNNEESVADLQTARQSVAGGASAASSQPSSRAPSPPAPSPPAPSPPAPSPPAPSPPAPSPPAPSPPSPAAVDSPVPTTITLRNASFTLGTINLDAIKTAFAAEPDKEIRLQFIRGMRAIVAESVKKWETAIQSLETYSESLEDKRTLDDFKCVVCFDKYRSCMGSNCSHIHLCEECAIKVTKTTKTCPWCRKRFESFNKVVF